MPNKRPIDILKELNTDHKQSHLPSFTEKTLQALNEFCEGSPVMARAAYQLLFNRYLLEEPPTATLQNIRVAGSLAKPIANDVNTNPRHKNILTATLFVRDNKSLGIRSAQKILTEHGFSDPTAYRMSYGYYEIGERVVLPHDMIDMLSQGFRGMLTTFSEDFVSKANSFK